MREKESGRGERKSVSERLVCMRVCECEKERLMRVIVNVCVCVRERDLCV